MFLGRRIPEERHNSLAGPSERLRMSSAESQKGTNTVQRCSIENQKGAIAMDFVQRYSALLQGSQWNIFEQRY